MARHTQPKKVKRARPPHKLLAWRKRIRRDGMPAELYHGIMIPMFKVKDPRHREVRDLVRAHHDKKRAIKKGA